MPISSIRLAKPWRCFCNMEPSIPARIGAQWNKRATTNNPTVIQGRWCHAPEVSTPSGVPSHGGGERKRRKLAPWSDVVEESRAAVLVVWRRLVEIAPTA
eukprot:3101991-Amphidinium_carterae.1